MRPCPVSSRCHRPCALARSGVHGTELGAGILLWHARSTRPRPVRPFLSLRRPTPWWWDSSHGSPGSASSATPGPQRRWSSCGPSSGSTMHSTTRRSPTSRPHSGGKKDDVCNLSTVAAKLSLSPPSAILVRLCSTFVVGLAGEDVESVCLVCWLPWHFGGSLFFFTMLVKV